MHPSSCAPSRSTRTSPAAGLSCDRLRWTSSFSTDPFPVTGCEVEVAFPSNGTRTLTLTGTDPQGATGTATVSVNVVDPPANLPPVVRITSPQHDGHDDMLALSGTATDPEGDLPLSFKSSVSVNSSSLIVIGTTPSMSWKPSDTIDFGSEGHYLVVLRTPLVQALMNLLSLSAEAVMASITIRNLDEDLKVRLRLQAAQHGRSMEEEARSILRAALSTEVAQAGNLLEVIRELFEPLGGVELPEMPREPIREPEDFGFGA